MGFGIISVYAFGGPLSLGPGSCIACRMDMGSWCSVVAIYSMEAMILAVRNHE